MIKVSVERPIGHRIVAIGPCGKETLIEEHNFMVVADPLPRCKHGACLMDGAGEILIPPCGCKIPRCRWCLQFIYEGIPEGKKRIWAHAHTRSRNCNADGQAWPGPCKHVASPQNTTPFEDDPTAGDS